MTLTRKLLFVIASGKRARLVRSIAGRFITFWRSADDVVSEGDLLVEVSRHARQHIAEAHLEGLVIVAPAGELLRLSAGLERSVVVVGVVAEDLYDRPDAALSNVLEKVLHAPLPER